MDLKALREMDLEQARQICLDELSDILTDYTERSVPLAPSSRLIEDLGLDSFLTVYFLTQRSGSASRLMRRNMKQLYLFRIF